MSRNIAEIEARISGTMEKHAMLEGCTALVVACSGGADSMALLHALSRLEFPILAAHVNHQLRGDEALRDEQAVQDFCEEYRIPFRIHREDVAARARREHKSVEECGREVRYRFFESLCMDRGDRIATAHTLSDSTETVLFHLAKGTGSRGLQGIPPVRGRIIRPLIGLTRAQVEEYCRWYQIPYVQDSTNFCRIYTRNRIRLDVIPVLREINPALEQAVERMSRQIGEDEAYLTQQARQFLEKAAVPGGYDAETLSQVPQPVLVRAIREMVGREAQRRDLPSIRLSSAQLEQVCEVLVGRFGKVSLGKGLSIRIERTLVSFVLGEVPKKLWKIPYQLPQTFTINRKTVTIHLENCANFEIPDNFHNLLFNNSLDYDTIPSNATWRNRREGDSFVPQGRKITKTLKKLFNEAKIPPSRRDALLLLEAGGEILWIEGFGAAEGYGVTGDTKQVLWISIEENV